MNGKRRYRNFREVPAADLLNWLDEHCMLCGSLLEQHAAQWQEWTAQAAEELSAEDLDYWAAAGHLGSHEAVRDWVREGGIHDPAYVKVYAVNPSHTGPPEEEFHGYACFECYSAAMDEALGASPDAPGHRIASWDGRRPSEGTTDWYSHLPSSLYQPN